MAEYEVDVPLREQDKNEIIKFSKNLRELADVKLSIETVELLKDASEEIILVDEEEGSLKLCYGDVFVDSTSDEVENYLEDKISLEETKLKEFKEEKGQLEDSIKKTKQRLYARFGNSINLD
ncbi:hypothetical protein WA158_004152 [Blastocystis sp. Blastoise]